MLGEEYLKVHLEFTIFTLISQVINFYTPGNYSDCGKK